MLFDRLSYDLLFAELRMEKADGWKVKCLVFVVVHELSAEDNLSLTGNDFQEQVRIFKKSAKQTPQDITYVMYPWRL